MRQFIVTGLLLTSTLALAAAPKPDPQQSEAAAEEAAQQKRAAVQQLLQIIKGEPTIREVQRWTLEYYKLEPERIQAMATAARLKGLVPEIEGSLDNAIGHTFNNMKDGFYRNGALASADNPEGLKERTVGSNDSLTWRVRAVFNLDRLAFNSEALDAKSLNSLQENLVREVTTLYFGRRRLLAGLLLSPPNDDEELFYELTRLDEMTATLDALSGEKFAKKAWKWDQDEQQEPGKGKVKDGPAAEPKDKAPDRAPAIDKKP